MLNWLYNSVADFHELPKRWHRDLATVLVDGNPQAADAKIRGTFAMPWTMFSAASNPATSWASPGRK